MKDEFTDCVASQELYIKKDTNIPKWYYKECETDFIMARHKHNSLKMCL